MKKYEINSKTMALYAMNEKTRVYEEDRNFVVDKPANVIMEESCAYFGSSLSGRRKGTEKLIGSLYKAPVIVEETKDIIFFPTSSHKSNSCSWLRSSMVDRYYYKNGRLIIEFVNGDKLALNVSYGVIDNQILRSTRLESVLRSRKQKKEENN